MASAVVPAAAAEEGGVVEGAAGGVEPHHESVGAPIVARVECAGGGGEVAGPGLPVTVARPVGV